MKYKNSLKGNRDVSAASCSRFCANVCSLFIFGREQCFLDCLACRGVQGREADHGCITVNSAETNDCC